MATQIKHGTPGGEYSVIDNGPAPAATVLNAGAPIGYDTTTGAASQGSNPFSNGTIPDCINSATTILNSPATTRLLYRNPA